MQQCDTSLVSEIKLTFTITHRITSGVTEIVDAFHFHEGRHGEEGVVGAHTCHYVVTTSFRGGNVCYLSLESRQGRSLGKKCQRGNMDSQKMTKKVVMGEIDALQSM